MSIKHWAGGLLLAASLGLLCKYGVSLSENMPLEQIDGILPGYIHGSWEEFSPRSGIRSSKNIQQLIQPSAEQIS